MQLDREQQFHLSALKIAAPEWEDQYEALLETVVHALAYPHKRPSLASVDLNCDAERLNFGLKAPKTG